MSWFVAWFELGSRKERGRKDNDLVVPSLRNAWGPLLLSFALLSGSVVLVFTHLLRVDMKKTEESGIGP